MMPTATVTSKGQVTIPKAVREVLGVDAGDQIDFIVNDHGEVTVRGVGGDVRELRGLLKRPGRRAVTVEEMNAAILRHHARKR
jgi:AbrB family looped-hinge helix DNA binding protein